MKRLALLAVLLLGVCAGAARADSQQVTHVKGVTIDLSGPDAYYTAVCGFPVTDSMLVVGTSTLFYENGLVVREEDLAPNTKWSMSSANGSISWAIPQPMRTEYPGGAQLGSTANVTLTGLQMKLPGLPADTGRVTFSAVVVDFWLGTPIVDYPTNFGVVGHWNDQAAVDAAVCAALG